MKRIELGDWVFLDDTFNAFVTKISWSSSHKAHLYTLYIPKNGSEYKAGIGRFKKLETEVFDCTDIIDLALDTKDKQWFLLLVGGKKTSN